MSDAGWICTTVMVLAFFLLLGLSWGELMLAVRGKGWPSWYTGRTMVPRKCRGLTCEDDAVWCPGCASHLGPKKGDG